MDAVERIVWGSCAVGLLALVVVVSGCASPHFLVGDAIVCSKGGDYREKPDGNVRMICEGEMRWTGPMSDKAANVSLGILKAAAEAASPVP